MSNPWFDAWPADADVRANIEAQGITAPTIDLTPRISVAVVEFERLTGYKPFLGELVDQVYSFDPPPPNGPLRLGSGFWSVTSLFVGVTSDSPGTQLVQDQDFKLMPYNAALESPPRPWTEIIIAGLVRILSGAVYAPMPVPSYNAEAMPASVVVTGKKGWQHIPADVWQAVVDYASATAVPALARAAMVKEGPVTLEYSRSGGDTLWDTWMNNWTTVIDRYALWEI